MKSDIKSVLQSIFNDETTGQSNCQLCRHQLPAYIESELDGQEAFFISSTVKQHLAECQECQEEYKELKTLLLRERQGELAQPSFVTFDLSLLEQDISTPDLWKFVGMTRRLFTEISVVIGQKMASFGRLPDWLTLEPVAMSMSRTKAAGVKEQLQGLKLPDPEHNLVVGLKMGPTAGDKTTLSIQVETSASQSPGRPRVTLREREHRMLLQSESIGDNKEVTFKDIDAGSYWIEVKYQNQLWELPITFISEEEKPGSTGK